VVDSKSNDISVCSKRSSNVQLVFHRDSKTTCSSLASSYRHVTLSLYRLWPVYSGRSTPSMRHMAPSEGQSHPALPCATESALNTNMMESDWNMTEVMKRWYLLEQALFTHTIHAPIPNPLTSAFSTNEQCALLNLPREIRNRF
jgi:hypothetical protein